MNHTDKQELIKSLSEYRAMEYRALGRYVAETPKDHSEYDLVVSLYIEDIAHMTSEIDALMGHSDDQ